MSNYPPGAEFDPNAPYNRPISIEERYGDEADAIIKDEIRDFDDNFVDFLVENGLAPAIADVQAEHLTDETLDAIYQLLQKDPIVLCNYREQRFEYLVESLASNDIQDDLDPFEYYDEFDN